MTWKIPLFKIHTDEADVNAVSEVIRSGMHWANGPSISDLEAAVAKYVGSRYAVAVNSGTSALYTAMLAHGIGRGDEVIVPSFTFIATVNAPLMAGATPVFGDIEYSNYGLDPRDVEKKITADTKAIIPVHVAGRTCEIKHLREIADDHDLILIEDAAGALGARDENGTMAGSWGDSGIFSFCASKIVTAGEGGIIVTNSEDLYEQMKLIRSHGRADTEDYFSSNKYMDYLTAGHNFRMSSITAALALSQLNKIDLIIKKRRKNALYLSEKLSEIDGITPPEDTFCHTYQMYMVEAFRRDMLMEYLSSCGIMSKVYYPLVHKTAFYQAVMAEEIALHGTLGVSNMTLTLPMYPSLTKKEMDYIAESIGQFYTAISS